MSDAQSLKALPVKELRKILQDRGISYADCIEKQDLVQRILDSEKSGKAKPTKQKSGLHFVTRDSPGVKDRFDAVVIVMHGFRANELDLVPVVDSLFSQPGLRGKYVRCIFPRAPIEIDPPTGLNSPGGYAWWPLDLNALMMKMMTQGPDKLFADGPPQGLTAARELVLNLIKDQQAATGLPLSKFIIGGFSQGSMLALDVACALPEAPAGVVVFSGVLLDQKGWEAMLNERAQRLKQKPKEALTMQVLQSHGTQDPLLLYQLGTNLQTWLKSRRTDFALDFLSFNGGHTLPQEAIGKMYNLIVSTANKQAAQL